MTNHAILGLGFMAATHIRALQKVPGARLAALCNPSGRHLDGDFTDVSGNHGDKEPLILDMADIKAFQEPSKLFADPEIDVVHICTPTITHPGLVTAALRSGKHVLCEKPVARTSEDALEMAAVARENGRILMPAMCLRFFPEWAAAKTAIDEGTYGKVLGGRFRRVGEPPAWGQQFFLDGSKSGGALLDLHIHDVDFIHYCFGKPRALYATGYNGPSGAIDYVVSQYAFGSGVSVHAEAAWTMTPGFGFTMEYTLNFERATLDYDLLREGAALKLYEEEKEPQTLTFDQEDGYVGEIAHLSECISEGLTESGIPPEDGVTAIQICEAEERSVRSGEVIAL